MNEEERLRRVISRKIRQLYRFRKENKPKFIPGKTWIQYAGSVFDNNEVNASVTSLLDGWFGLGPKGEELEKNLAKFLGVKGSILANSGSSSNLLVIASLMSPLLPEHMNPKDEVIIAACGYPTTLNPLIIYHLMPVFLDVDPETYNIYPEDLGKALSKRTRAVFIAHTLGNPNEMDEIIKFCRKHNLFLIEDNCDSLGSKYNGKKTGSFGILSTQSFYPPHHITMGEGGAVNYNDFRFERITRSLRDWGRACWCRGDEKRTLGTCQARFSFKVDGKRYDHKYIFNQIGYNLKPIEPQAAMGVEQLKRMPFFMKKRRENFDRLYRYAKKWKKYFILPKELLKSKPCWFAFPLTIRDEVKFNRHAIVRFLEKRMIQTRPIFAGNFIKQPAYANIKYRKIGNLENADRVLHRAFFLGVYPALGEEEIDFIAESIDKFLKKYG